MKLRLHIQSLLTAGLISLSACGFQPLYGVNKYEPVGVEAWLGVTEIGNIPDREGQALRNLLIDRFYREGRPADPIYNLTIRPINEQLIDLGITKSANATRGQLRLSTSMYLRDIQSGTLLVTRKLSATTSYNILGSEFATRVTEENARQNALLEIARQAEHQLNLYFKRQNEL